MRREPRLRERIAEMVIYFMKISLPKKKSKEGSGVPFLSIVHHLLRPWSLRKLNWFLQACRKFCKHVSYCLSCYDLCLVMGLLQIQAGKHIDGEGYPWRAHPKLSWWGVVGRIKIKFDGSKTKTVTTNLHSRKAQASNSYLMNWCPTHTYVSTPKGYKKQLTAYLKGAPDLPDRWDPGWEHLTKSSPRDADL